MGFVTIIMKLFKYRCISKRSQYLDAFEFDIVCEPEVLVCNRFFEMNMVVDTCYQCAWMMIENRISNRRQAMISGEQVCRLLDFRVQ